jgi:hypothetical protein
MSKLRLRVFLAIAALIALASCGGGGGGGGDPAPTPTPTPVPTTPTITTFARTATTPAVPGPTTGSCPNSGDPDTVTLSGTARFENVPFVASPTSAALNYSGIAEKPIRGAVVQILCSPSNAVLRMGETDATGNYSIAIPSTANVVVRVRAQLFRSGTPAWNFRILDNTNLDALYVLDMATPGNATATVNLVADSGHTSGTTYGAPRASGPFALLDVIYEALQRTLVPAPSQVWPPLNLFWSVNNRPSSGSLSQGFIGTSHFRSGTTSTTASIYILGQADVDTDEFDKHVVAHEFGHYLQWAVSLDDSIGGSHSTNDRLDMRVAFSEGWGNGWSGIVFNDSIYRDSSGSGQQGGFTMDVSAPVNVQPGWYKELSIQSIVWNVNQQLGFAPLWTALTGPLRTTNDAVTSPHLLAAALKQVAPSQAGTVTTLFANQSINTADAYGTGETNDGGIASVLPIYKTYGAIGSTLNTLCVEGTAGASNKLGSVAFARVTIPSTRVYSIRLQGGSDPDFTISNSSVIAFGISADAGLERQDVSLEAGSYVIAVEDFNLFPGQAQLCLSLTIN